MRKSISAVALVAAASMTVVGLAPAASAADGVEVAKAVVAKYSKAPTSIGNLPIITNKIPKGKYVITITNATDAAVTLNKYTVEGGKLLGWKMEALQAESTLEGQRKTLQQAIAKKPASPSRAWRPIPTATCTRRLRPRARQSSAPRA
jgi:hypothetical protein